MLGNLLKAAAAIVAAPITIVSGTLKATGKAVGKVAEELTSDDE